jgi:hypothetical protein
MQSSFEHKAFLTGATTFYNIGTVF